MLISNYYHGLGLELGGKNFFKHQSSYIKRVRVGVRVFPAYLERR